MIVRALDSEGDWTYGSGRNNYRRNILAVAQNIQTRLSSFLGDCFFSLDSGVDWFNILGAKDKIAVNLAVSSTILNTTDVTGILQLFVNLDAQRVLSISYNAQTTYSRIVGNDFVYDFGTVG